MRQRGAYLDLSLLPFWAFRGHSLALPWAVPNVRRVDVPSSRLTPPKCSHPNDKQSQFAVSAKQAVKVCHAKRNWWADTTIMGYKTRNFGLSNPFKTLVTGGQQSIAGRHLRPLDSQYYMLFHPRRSCFHIILKQPFPRTNVRSISSYRHLRTTLVWGG